MTAVTDMLARLPQQLKDKPRIAALLTAFGGQLDVLRGVFADLQLARSIDDAVGVQLDTIGKVVRQARNGLDDVTYRRYLRTRIAVSRSTGRSPELINIARLFIGKNAPGQISLQNTGRAALMILIDETVLTAAEKAALLSFLQQAAKAGVRVVLEAETYADDSTFYTSRSTHMTANPTLSGATAIVVDSTAGFPDSGTIHLAPGDTVNGDEIMIYTNKTSTVFNLQSATANTYPQFSDVQLIGSRGRGFALDAPTTPGTISPGSASITVDDASAFPAAGTIEVDGGIAGTAEVLAYTSHTGTVFTLAGTTAFTHLAGAAVTDAGADAGAGGALVDDNALS